MYGNQDFSVRPPSQFQGIRSNFVSAPNYEMHTQQNCYYPPNAYFAPVNMNYVNFNPHFNNDNEESSLIDIMETRGQDELMIENFLRENENEFKFAEKNNDRGSRISEACTALMSVNRLTNELEKLRTELKQSRDVPETEWRTKIAAASSKQAEIQNVLNKLEDDKFINKVKTDVRKRRSKRLREKKQRVSKKAEKLAARERRAKLHAKADAWIKDKQDVIEKEKQEISMRKDADLILAEVRGRRNDARKFLALLQEMRNLRKIQVNIARARGEHLSAAADEAFTNIIEKLVEQWTAMDREYSMEEQGLKLMLKTDNDKKIEKQKKNVFVEWENTLFGRKLPTIDLFQRNVHAFVTTRAAWDKYVSNDELGSPIPIGWVMPDPPSSAAWQKYLTTE